MLQIDTAEPLRISLYVAIVVGQHALHRFGEASSLPAAMATVENGNQPAVAIIKDVIEFASEFLIGNVGCAGIGIGGNDGVVVGALCGVAYATVRRYPIGRHA